MIDAIPSAAAVGAKNQPGASNAAMQERRSPLVGRPLWTPTTKVPSQSSQSFCDAHACVNYERYSYSPKSSGLAPIALVCCYGSFYSVIASISIIKIRRISCC
ncbi:hypothetical protein L596_020214 [Steinernema carpocapsae]|uniref:Uncharacterized protein n=1 Tax=Steinernema carpocapsae TaxID=34508 RepID=A0A4U5MT23_STECR|nr:hypothetical protein L596_020214 [Steinernema carpocapsae]